MGLRRSRFVYTDPLTVLVIASLGRLGINGCWCTELIVHLPVECGPTADEMNIVRTGYVGTEVRHGALEVVINIMLRVDVVEGHARTEGIASEQRFGIEKAGQRLEIGHHKRVLLIP